MEPTGDDANAGGKEVNKGWARDESRLETPWYVFFSLLIIIILNIQD
jgi:hypothetical protein